MGLLCALKACFAAPLCLYETYCILEPYPNMFRLDGKDRPLSVEYFPCLWPVQQCTPLGIPRLVEEPGVI